MLSSQESPDWTLGPFLIQTLFILLAPALFAASIYMELGRIILLVDGEEHSVIRRRWLTKLFVLGDLLSFMTQSSGESPESMLRVFVQVNRIGLIGIIGGSLMASGKQEDMDNGAHIVVGGLLVQIFFFSFFMTVMIIFDRRMKKRPTEKYSSLFPTARKHMRALYASSTLIMIRNIFRTIEYVQGEKGYLLRHEYYLYIFDAVFMFGVLLVFNVVHPSEVKALLRGGKLSKGFKMVTLENGRSHLQQTPSVREEDV